MSEKSENNNQTTDYMKVTIPMAILTLIVSVIVAASGWVLNNTLNTINTNINELKLDIRSLTDVRYDHEGRLKALEKEVFEVKNSSSK